MANYLEQQVEELIRAAIQTAVGASGTVTGWRQPSLSGTVKQGLVTGVLVKIAPRSNVAFGSALVSLNCVVDIQVTCDDSANGDLLTTLEAAVFSVLNAWHRSPETMAAALAVAGVFDPGGFIFTEGGDCDFDVSNALWYSTIPVQIKGRIIN